MAESKDLFGKATGDMQFIMPEKKRFMDLWKTVNGLYTKDRMEEIYTAFRKQTVGHAWTVVGGDAVVDRQTINASFKKNVKTKDDYARFLAVLVGVKENLLMYLNSLTPGSQKLFNTVVRVCYLSVSKAKKICRMRTMSDSYYYSSTRYSKEFAWFYTTDFDTYSYSDSNSYLYFPAKIYEYFLQALMPEAYDQDVYIHEEIEDGSRWRITNLEKNVFTDVPLIEGLFSQGIVSPGSSKVLTASAEKKIAQFGLQDFVLRANFQNMRPHMLAAYIASMSRDGYVDVDGHTVSIADQAKTVAKECLGSPGDYFQICLPYIDGIKKSMSESSNFKDITRYVRGFLYTFGKDDKWLKSQCLLYHAYSNLVTNRYSILAYTPSRYSMNAVAMNPINGNFIGPDSIVANLTLAFLLGYIYFLASWGIVEIVEDKTLERKQTYSPFDQLKAFRLTALGRYAVGLANSYTPPKEEKKVWFELDDERLIYRSLSDNNPYIVILKDVSNSIGGGRYEVTAESFLSHCSTREDVEKKIDVFKQYIGRELPQVWKDFFNEMLRHCQPLEKLPVTNYKMYRVAKDNVALQRLLTTDEKLRSLVIRAEGYRILVAKNDMQKFENRLKSFGYLL